MAAGRLNPRRAKFNRSYSVAETADLFGVHRNTVRNWIKRGLPLVKTTGEKLILGRDLRPFLERRRAARRRKCGPGKLFCLRCREPRSPRPQTLSAVQTTPTGMNLAALCDVCGARMHRRGTAHSLTAAGFDLAALHAGGLEPNR